MNIKVTTRYKDKQLGRFVKVDEIILVDDERGNQIIQAGYAIAINNISQAEEAPEMEYAPPVEHTAEYTPRRGRKRKSYGGEYGTKYSSNTTEEDTNSD